MIAYSPDAEPARAYLLRAYNDIDIFVEDASCQNMYIRLLGRIIGPDKRISQVFPLNSRSNVIARCASDQAPRPRKRLYIIDADEDLLRGVPNLPLKHFYRLGAYCSENLLLSEHAVVTLATECLTNELWADLAIKLQFRHLVEKAVNSLFSLFILYGIVRELNLSIETVSFPVHRLLNDPTDPHSLSPERIKSRIYSIARDVVKQTSLHNYQRARSTIKRQLDMHLYDHSAFISGKTYLLPLVYLQLRRCARLNESMDRMKVRLAQHCELTIEPGFQQAVLKELEGGRADPRA